MTDPAALKIILEALPPQAPGPLVGHPVVVRSGRPSRTELTAAATLPVQWKIVTGKELIAKGDTSDRAIEWPTELPLGIYRLQVSDADNTEDVPLISAPKFPILSPSSDVRSKRLEMKPGLKSRLPSSALGSARRRGSADSSRNPPLYRSVLSQRIAAVPLSKISVAKAG